MHEERHGAGGQFPTLEKSQTACLETSQKLQADMADALSKAVLDGEETAKNRLYVLIQQRTSRPGTPKPKTLNPKP